MTLSVMVEMVCLGGASPWVVDTLILDLLDPE
jgi:hypothetical protein